MEGIYTDGKYKKANPTWHEEDAPWKAKQIEKILTRNKVIFRRACEVGCGAGGILEQLAGRFTDADFHGYDISPDAVRMAEKKKSPRLHFYEKDILRDPPAHFDLVMVIDVIEHVEEYMSFTRKVKDLGEYKVFHIPLDLSVQSILRMRPILSLRESVGHIHYFFKDTALALLKDCKYEILDWCYTGSRLELPNQALSSRIVAKPRAMFYRLNSDLTVRVLGGYSLLVLAR
jgi:hypothetical protein